MTLYDLFNFFKCFHLSSIYLLTSTVTISSGLLIPPADSSMMISIDGSLFGIYFSTGHFILKRYLFHLSSGFTPSTKQLSQDSLHPCIMRPLPVYLVALGAFAKYILRSEEHTSELQSR